MPNDETIDYALRAMTDDGAFRVMCARTTAMTRAVAAAQQTGPEPSRWLAELLTATVLVRETMAPSWRVQSIIEVGDKAGRLIADSHPDGSGRSLWWSQQADRHIDFGGAVLQIMRSLPNGAVHRGLVEIPSEGGISQALVTYLHDSEQVVSMAAVGCALDGDGQIQAAGGYLVQLLPEVQAPPLAIMAQRLEDFVHIDQLLADTAADPEILLGELLYGFPFTPLERRPLSFGCPCSQVRMLAGLSTLPRRDLEELIAAGEPLELNCEYCRKAYVITPIQLTGLLQAS